MSKLAILLLLSVSILSGCAARVENSTAAANVGVVGGTPVTASDAIAASTVSVFQLDAAKTTLVTACSGSLISKDLVVTAAHCFYPHLDGVGAPAPASQMMVYLGNSDPATGVQNKRLLRAVSYRIQPGFNGSFYQGQKRNDLAIIRFKAVIPAPYHPIAVASTQLSLSVGEPVIVAGYGSMDGSSERETVFSLNRYDQYRISAFFPSAGLVDLSGPAGAGSFAGDSGGPAFVNQGGRLKLWGVISAGRLPTGVAEISDLRGQLNWISATAQALGTTLNLN